jgi:hypothetical protein
MKRRLHLLNGLAATLLLTGCMGYRLGGSRPAGIESVAMAPVVNATGEPAIEIQVTHAMRERIQFDGRMQLVNDPENADALIEIRLTDFSMSPIAFRSDLKTTPLIYRLRITGTARLRSTATGEVLSEASTYGEATFDFKSDLTTSKRDAEPIAAREIAKFMLDDMIERW